VKRAAFVGGCAAASVAALAFPGCAMAGPSLQHHIAKIVRDMSGTAGVYARAMDDGRLLAAYQSAELFPTASTIKVLIMATAFMQEEQNPGTLDAVIVTSRSDLIGGSDFMMNATDGEKFTVRQLIVPMITVSDNTAANTLMTQLGIDAIDELGLQAGLERTHLQRKFIDAAGIVKQVNVSTAADMGRLLYLIEKGARQEVATIVSPQHCRDMIDIMLKQTDREKIPGGLPPGTPVANKTGEITGTRNDVAIVDPYGDVPFVLTIMTKGITDYDTANASIHAITHAVYRAVNGTP
jgi:beta-lactamase class A